MQTEFSTHSISKVLSPNDVGSNGSHQAGILIPKRHQLLSFFPFLDATKKNPRVQLSFFDEFETIWQFMYIYYNNKYFDGTRNEFRLTGLTRYFKENFLRAGDKIIFSINEAGKRYIRHERADKQETNDFVIRLSDRWTVINIKEKKHV